MPECLKAFHVARAYKDAVSARRIPAPRETRQSRHRSSSREANTRSSSPGAQPPSGPTKKTAGLLLRSAARALRRGTVASLRSSHTKKDTGPFAARPATAASRLLIGSTEGTVRRSDCSAASIATASCLVPSSSSSPCFLPCTLCVTTGCKAATPNSVAFSTTSRSCFG